MLIKAYAKVNLFLDVLDKRQDGMHNILSLMHTINLYDTLYLNFSDKEHFETDAKFDCLWEKNSIKKAIETFKRLTGYTDFNLSIRLIKRIPFAGGLGGSSADAAAVLRFLGNTYNIPEKDLLLISSQTGSDVPFMLNGGTAIVSGKGDVIEHLEKLILNIKIHPQDFQLKTPEMYKFLDEIQRKRRSCDEPLKLYEFLKKNNVDAARDLAFNAFEQKAFELFPLLKKLKIDYSAMPECIFCLMSGSGSSLFSVLKKRGYDG